MANNRRSIERLQILNSRSSPVKANSVQANYSIPPASNTTLVNQNGQAIPYDPHLMIASLIHQCQNPRIFFMFDKDNADKMFGYRIKYLGPEDDENEDMCYAYRHVPQPDSKPPPS